MKEHTRQIDPDGRGVSTSVFISNQDESQPERLQVEAQWNTGSPISKISETLAKRLNLPIIQEEPGTVYSAALQIPVEDRDSAESAEDIITFSEVKFHSSPDLEQDTISIGGDIIFEGTLRLQSVGTKKYLSFFYPPVHPYTVING